MQATTPEMPAPGASSAGTSPPEASSEAPRTPTPVPPSAALFDARLPGSLPSCVPCSLPGLRPCQDVRLLETAGRPVGLPNRSCDCFWLATMQCLRHTSGFLGALSGSVVDDGRPVANLAQAVAGLLRAMQLADPGGCVLPDCQALGEFYLHAMNELTAPAAGGKKLLQWDAKEQRQQDAHEFLSQLLSHLGAQLGDCEQQSLFVPGDTTRLAALQQELAEAARTVTMSRSKEAQAAARSNGFNLLFEYSVLQWSASATRMKSRALSAIFEGQRLTSITCKECGRYGASEAEPFTIEEVKLNQSKDNGWLSQIQALFVEGAQGKEPPSLTLGALLRSNSERSAPEGYRCPNPRCRSIGKSTRKMRFLRLPSVLVLHVNRAQPDDSRCGAALEFEPTLDLCELGLVADLGKPVDRDWEPCRTLYRLMSVVFHRGASARSGHYFAHVLFAGSWLCVNDEAVTETQAAPWELEASEPATGARVALLFYQRVCE